MPNEPGSAPLRYVVLSHEGWDEPHFDLMFEREPNGPLVTWRSPVWPLVDGTTLVQLGEHRRDYLDYEGPVSGNRGQVRRIAAGSFQWLRRGPDLTLIRLLAPEPKSWLIATDPQGRARAKSA